MSNNKILKTLAILCLPIIVDAQILHNNGATFFVNTGATVQVNGAVKNEATSNWQNEGTVNIVDSFVNDQNIPTPTSGTTRFEGTTMQIVSGAAPLNTYDVVFDNASGVTLNTNLYVSHQAFFNNGIVQDGPTDRVLVFGTSATVGNTPSDASHVNGRVAYDGIGAFTFPIGDGIRYQPIGVNLTSNADGMGAQYFASDAGAGSFTATGTEATPLVAYNAKEHWNFVEDGATGTVTMYWDDYNNSGITDIAHLKVAHKSGANWLNEGNVATGTVASGSVTSNTISSWSPFTLGSINISSPLPISLLSFTGKKETNKNILNWITSMEQNNAYFNVQHSSNARDFVTIGKVATKAVNSNSSVNINYELHDENPKIGHNYYRLEQVDIDGKTSFSKVIDLHRESNGYVVNVYPNPTSSILHIELNSDIEHLLSIKLSDLSGRLIKEIKTTNNVSQIDMSNIAIGMYLLQVEQDNQIISTQKVDRK